MISVIIPFYNVDAGLFTKCIDSILCQTVGDFEIIVVDDGSGLEGQATLREAAKKDSRIRVVHQQNKGASDARNHGVAEARGDFLVFVDADDGIAPRFFEQALAVQQQEDADLVIGGNVRADRFEAGENHDRPEYEVYRGDACKTLKRFFVGGELKRISGTNGYYGRGPWTRLVRRGALWQIGFGSDLIQGEDIVWNLKILDACKCVCMVNAVWTLYTWNENSLTHRYNKNMFVDVDHEMKEIIDHVDLEDDCEYTAYCDKMLDELKKAALCYFNYPKREPDRARMRGAVREAYHAFPWTMLREKRYLSLADKKYKLLAWLYRRKMLFLFYRIKR